MRQISYGFGKDLTITYEQALTKVPEALKKEGFGVLTEIDIKATMKKKLDADFRKYMILGACNPPLAHRALSAELEIGILLPCNVIVFENDSGKASVMAMDPKAAMSMIENDEVAKVAEEVREKLAKVIEAL